MGQVSHKMWFYNTGNEVKAELIRLNAKTDCDKSLHLVWRCSFFCQFRFKEWY